MLFLHGGLLIRHFSKDFKGSSCLFKLINKYLTRRPPFRKPSLGSSRRITPLSNHPPCAPAARAYAREFATPREAEMGSLVLKQSVALCRREGEREGGTEEKERERVERATARKSEWGNIDSKRESNE